MWLNETYDGMEDAFRSTGGTMNYYAAAIDELFKEHDWQKVAMDYAKLLKRCKT
jgi:hypothetical protein